MGLDIKVEPSSAGLTGSTSPRGRCRVTFNCPFFGLILRLQTGRGFSRFLFIDRLLKMGVPHAVPQPSFPSDRIVGGLPNYPMTAFAGPGSDHGPGCVPSFPWFAGS